MHPVALLHRAHLQLLLLQKRVLGFLAEAHLCRLFCVQAASIEECRKRCPGLVVRPMRTDRYREASWGAAPVHLPLAWQPWVGQRKHRTALWG